MMANYDIIEFYSNNPTAEIFTFLFLKRHANDY